MDVVALQAAKADAAKKFSPPSAYAAIEKLNRGQDNVVIGVLGDSTGDDTHGTWFSLLSSWLGSKYPNYSVVYQLWNDPNGTSNPPLGGAAYNAPTTLQAGIAPATVTDTFTRADQTGLGNADTGQTWTTVANLNIVSNKAASVTASGSSAYLDLGASNYTLSIDVGLASGVSNRVFIRYIDANNHYYAELSPGSTNGTLNLWQRIAGTATKVATVTGVTAIAAGSVVTLSVTTTPTSISATAGGQTISRTLRASDGPLITGHMAGIYASNSGCTFDNLTVTPAAPALLCYNGSQAGQVCSYAQARIRALIPYSADLIFINFGHNESGTDATPQYQLLGRTAQTLYPGAQLISIGQNPRAASNGLYAPGIAKNLTIARLAQRENWGYVNVTQLFLNHASYASDWLQGDGIHPTTAGSQAWAAEVEQHLARPATRPTPPARSPGRFLEFLPAAQMIAFEGAPTLAVVNSQAAGWSLDPTTQQSVMGTLDIPAEWVGVDIFALITAGVTSGLTGSTQGVRLEFGAVALGDTTGTTNGNGVVNDLGAVGSFGTTGSLTSTLSTLNLLNNAAGGQYIQTVASSAPITGRPLSIRLRRVAADAADTFAGTVYLLGLYARRAS